MTSRNDWSDKPDAEHPVRVEFAGPDPDSWLSIEAALDRINPTDRDLARAALVDGGATFLTIGARYSMDPDAMSSGRDVR